MTNFSGGQLGSQPTDPAFLRAIVALVSGTTQDLLFAQSNAVAAMGHELAPDDDLSPHQDSDDQWWKTLDYSWALVTHQIGRNDIRPLFFYTGRMTWNADYVSKLVGDLTWSIDPSGIVATQVSVTPSLVSRWLDQWAFPLAGQRSFSASQLADVVAILQTAHRAVAEARGIDPSQSSVLRDLPATIWRDPAFQDYVQSAFNRTYALVTGSTAPSTVQRLFDMPAAGVEILVRGLVGTLAADGRVNSGDDPALLVWARGYTPAPTTNPTIAAAKHHPVLAVLLVAAIGAGGVLVYRRRRRPGARS